LPPFLTGNRLAQVHSRRTKREFALFCQAVAAAYPQAPGFDSFWIQHPQRVPFTNTCRPMKALAQRFDFFYTPKSASWLNMIEIEFSALSRLCLQRRIPTREMLESELLAIIAERTEKRIKINWQFSIEVCRQKLNSRYSIVNEANSKFMEVPII
jgi:hypothetical protein